jgi:hypothetical protein
MKLVQISLCLEKKGTERNLLVYSPLFFVDAMNNLLYHGLQRC